MKFTDGNWFKRKGVQMIHPVDIFEKEIRKGAVSLFAAPYPVVNRGVTINMPLLEIQLSSPFEDVIHVQLFHHKGIVDHGPHFQVIADSQEALTVKEDDGYINVQSGKLTARVSKKQPWNIDFLYDGRRITRSSSRNSAYISVHETDKYMREQLDLAVGECVYGFGERFTSFVKNGQTIETWNSDGGTGSDQAYKSIPFYISNKGYGIFVNHPEQVSFEVASEHVTKVQFSVPGEHLDYYVIGGNTPKQVLENYTTLTGKPALPPAWSFGLWLSTSFTTNYDEQTVTHFVDGMAQRDLPVHVFHFDCFWMKGEHWCDFEWDDQVFPDPQGMLTRLKQKGLHICAWINPYIGQRSSLFEEGKRHGYFLKDAKGNVWQRDEWQAGMAIVDFTNPQACEWYTSKLKELIAMGVDCFKTDFGERIPTDVVYFDGSDPVKMHNYYAFLYNKVVFDMLEEQRGKGEAVLFARAATAGSQQFPVHWGGDCNSTYESMAESLRGGLSFGLSGFGFWSHDIGGFEHTSTSDVYKRWIAFGMLSSHSRLHGSHSYRVPWSYDEESVDVLRTFTRLKCRLMPYLYKEAVTTATHGFPMMRAMLLEFGNDPAVNYLDQQYMLGDSLLVAPVFNPEGDVSFYVPEGIWTHLMSNKQIEGGRWYQENHGYQSLPLYVRPNSIIAVGSDENRPDYNYAHNVEFHLFEIEDNRQASTVIYDQQGQQVLQAFAERHGDRMIFYTEGKTDQSWSIVLRNIYSITPITGATTKEHIHGIQLFPEDGSQAIEVHLSADL